MAISKNLVSTIGAQASPKKGTEPGFRRVKMKYYCFSLNIFYFYNEKIGLGVSWNNIITALSLQNATYNIVMRHKQHIHIFKWK